MMLVTLADACLRLPELIDLVARGEHVVIVQNGVTLATLMPPLFAIPTPEEEAARQTRIDDAIREMQAWREEAKIPLATDSPLRQPESPAA